MRAIQITHIIPEDTISLESGREISKMSEEDLLWCFGAEVIFKSFSTESILLDLEVALFDFLTKFLGVISNFNTFNTANFNDPYGTYSLEFCRQENEITIADSFNNKSLKLDLKELIIASQELVIECFKDLDIKFPELLSNSYYLRIKENLLNCRWPIIV